VKEDEYALHNRVRRMRVLHRKRRRKERKMKEAGIDSK